RIEVENHGLAKNGLADVEAYVQGAQKALVEELAKVVSPSPEDVYFLILDKGGNVVLHPRQPAGSSAYASAPWVKELSARPGGAIETEIDGRPTWLAFERFEPWS